MSNDYIFFILTILLYLFIFEMLKKAQMSHYKKESEEQRTGSDRRQLFMYRIPERRGLSGGENKTDRRGSRKTLSQKEELRNGRDRREGNIRRKSILFKIPERRLIGNRREGLDRRKTGNPIDPVVA